MFFNLLRSRNGRFLSFALMYVSEGVPQGFVGTAMVAYMRREGMPVDQIGYFAAALALPWAFKWAWAPLVDLIKLDRFGGRKAWIVSCTVLMTATLMTAAVIDFTTNFQLLVMILVCSNIFTATQDIAIDSLAVRTLQDDERGRASGLMWAGTSIGYGLGGGGAMYVSGLMGFNAALLFVSGLLVLNLLFILIFVVDPDAGSSAVKKAGLTLKSLFSSLLKLYLEILNSFFNSGIGPRVGLVFTLLPPGAFVLVGAMYNAMLVDSGRTVIQIADINVIGGVIYAVGSVAGGFLGDRYGLRKIMAAAYALTTLPTLFMAFQISSVGLQGLSIEMLYSVIFSHWFFSGMCTGLRIATLMRLTNPAVAASQFTAFMAFSSLGVGIANYWQGKMAHEMGYETLLYVDSALVIIPVLLIPFLRNREAEELVPDVLNRLDGSA